MNGHTRKLLAGAFLLALSGAAWAENNWNINWFTIDSGGFWAAPVAGLSEPSIFHDRFEEQLRAP